ncbi:protein of unknown function (plasmid) [Thermococcus nautili]|uniref:hypothetical protein n=1 Tax=Thermococcus nautili TaxID=195522 RepID=UPI002554C64F|nr:hypothetical protein [Thermococcus nautili]CAI1494283.1 protein of unknown function [Thermococcus nautili]
MWIEAVGEGRIVHYLRASKVVEFWLSNANIKASMPLRKLNIKIEGNDFIFKLYYPYAPHTLLDIWVLDNFRLIPYLDNELPQFTVNWDNLAYPYTDLGAVALLRFLENKAKESGETFEDMLEYYTDYDKDPIKLDELKESLPLSIYELGDLPLFRESITGGFYGSRIFKVIGSGEYTIKDPNAVMGFKEELEKINEIMKKFGEIYYRELGIKTGLEEVLEDGS